jgi:hypothetical protein
MRLRESMLRSQKYMKKSQNYRRKKKKSRLKINSLKRKFKISKMNWIFKSKKKIYSKSVNLQPKTPRQCSHHKSDPTTMSKKIQTLKTWPSTYSKNFLIPHSATTPISIRHQHGIRKIWCLSSKMSKTSRNSLSFCKTNSNSKTRKFKSMRKKSVISLISRNKWSSLMRPECHNWKIKRSIWVKESSNCKKRNWRHVKIKREIWKRKYLNLSKARRQAKRND